ncbi:unnamed protein product [Rotaria magnacalcarata]|uniref:Nudix hydrolase domain-containing protein n=1 Tax=Rotaria magnacalcarata TaxID=392030 RepID=A0A815L343_9BILA|nr:unnamed protein product [Rotaria magnacalcarata]
MPGKYHFVAGHKEKSDGCLFTLLKETEEEAGIKLDVNDIKLVHTMYHKSNNERIGLFFKATNYFGEVKNMEPDKHATIEWFDIDNLPKNTAPWAVLVMEYIAKGLNFSEYTEEYIEN